MIFVGGQNYEQIATVQDRRLGEVNYLKSYTNGQVIFEKRAKANDKRHAEAVKAWLNVRCTVTHPNYWCPFQYKSYTKRKFCASYQMIKYYLEAVDTDL